MISMEERGEREVPFCFSIEQAGYSNGVFEVAKLLG
jgi:hypothetical protein